MKFWRLTKMQTGQMLRRKEFAFAFTAMLLFALSAAVYAAAYYIGWDRTLLPQSDWLFCGNQGMFAPLLIFLLAILPAAPFAITASDDRLIRSVPLLQTRASRKSYLFSKLMASFAGGFLVFFLPLLLNILLNFIIFPMSGGYQGDYLGGAANVFSYFSSSKENVLIFLGEDFLWPQLYFASPFWENVFIAAVIAVFAGALAVFACGVAWSFRRRKYLAIVPTFGVYWLFQSIASLFYHEDSGKDLSPAFDWLYLLPGRGHVTSLERWALLAEILLFLAVGIALTWRQSRAEYLD